MPSSIVFTTSGGLDSAWTRWADPVRLAWPGVSRPRLDWMPLEELVGTLERQSTRGESIPQAVFAVVAASTPPFQVDRLVEALYARNIPAVCLMSRPDDWRHFQRHGVIFENYEAKPEVIGSMLYALCERQGVVEMLARELALATRTEGGVRSQIDRLHEEMHLAASVQREFMPPPVPDVGDLDVGVLFRPVNYVSGDIYHAERLPGNKVGLFIADAVGHGVPAALLTMVLSHSLTTTEIGGEGGESSIIEPAEVLRRLNERLCRSRSGAGTGRFATAVYAVVDPARREVTLAGAGHPPPLLFGEGVCLGIETDGPLLGVFADAEFNQKTFSLQAGQTLVMYTDGLEAAFAEAGAGARRDSRRYVEYMGKLFEGARGLGSRRLMDDLTMVLDEQSGSLHQADDVTVLAISLPAEAGTRAIAA